MKQLWIEQIHCREQEDYSGYDNVRVDVHVDGVLVAVMRRNMSDSEASRRTWTIGKGYVYKDKAIVKVWEEDSPDGDDEIATLQFKSTTADGMQKKNFKKSGNYDITAGVNDVTPSEVQDPDWHLAEFEKSSKAGVWKNIPKPLLITDMRDILKNPVGTIKQLNAPLCGPASILYALVRRDPVKFVRMCRDLYENGRFDTPKLKIAPSQALKDSKVGFKMTAANWVVQASIRDSMNAAIDFTASSGGVAGITTAEEMQELAKEILGLNLDNRRTYAWGEVDAIKYAKSKHDSGGVAFMLVDVSMMPPRPPNTVRPQSAVYHPNHWIVYDGGLKIDPGVFEWTSTGNIRFDCWSWGLKLPITVSEERFEDCFFGVVA